MDENTVLTLFLTQPFLCGTQEARAQHLWMLISWLSDYSQHHGRKCRQCEPAWGPCPGSVYGWPGCYSHNNYPPPLSRTETDGSLRLMHSCGETEEEKKVIKLPKNKQDTHTHTANGWIMSLETQMSALWIKGQMRMIFCLCGFPLRLADWQIGCALKKTPKNSSETKTQTVRAFECLRAGAGKVAQSTDRFPH